MFLNSMEDNVSCKLRIPKDVNGKTPVFLVDFTNGNLKLNHSNKVEFSSYLPKDCRKEHENSKRILHAKSVLRYTSESDDVRSNGSKFNYFVGVRNKTSGKMKVYKSASFHLKPDLSKDITTSSEMKSYQEKSDELNKKFGSKSIQRSMKDRQKLKSVTLLQEETAQNTSLNESVEDTNQSSSLPPSSNIIDYLPPRNSDAQTVDEVYNVTDIISPVEFEYLNNAVDDLIESLSESLSQLKKDGTFCDYVLNHIEDGSIDKLKAKYLLYLNYLVSFSKLLSYDFKKKDPAQNIPEPIRSCFLDRFTASSKTENGKVVRNFPQKMKDKLLAYILVIALFIDSYSVNLADLQRGTKYGLPKVTTIAQALGCHVHRRKVDNISISVAELKLPLYVVYRKHK